MAEKRFSFVSESDVAKVIENSGEYQEAYIMEL